MVLVDSNVFFDAGDPGSPQHDWALALLDRHRGALGVNQVVLTELLAASDGESVQNGLSAFGVARLDIPWEACEIAARSFSRYLLRRKPSGEVKRSVPLPDFFIGAHAEVLGLPLATSDRRRFNTYFPSVRLLEE